MPAVLTIGGVDYTGFVTRDSLTHLNALGSEPDTLSFTLSPLAPLPSVSSEVYYTRHNEVDPCFGGVLVGFPRRIIGQVYQGISVTCSDWRVRLDAKFINKRWTAKTPGQIIVEAVERYAPEFDTSLVDISGSPVTSITYRRDGKLTDLLNKLCDITGYIWDVTPDKKVIFQAVSTMVCPIELTDTSRNFSNLVINVNRDDMRNAVYVSGRPQPAAVLTTDRFTGDGLTSGLRLTGTPYGLDNYIAFEDEFSRGVRPAIWNETDQTNPSPPPGYLPSDGYLDTRDNSGGITLAESGWLQILGGTSVWGQVTEMSQNPQTRGDGNKRFEWEVYVETAAKTGMFGLWNPANQTAQAGASHAFIFDGASGLIKPFDNGAVQTALASVAYTAGTGVRLRIIPKAVTGAVYWVNTDAANGFRASQWVKLYDSAAVSLTLFTIAAAFVFNFEGRVNRVRAYNKLYGVDLTVGGVAKIVGLLGIDADDGGVDALVGVNADVPKLAFFADTIPTLAAAVVISYFEAVPTSIYLRDEAAIAALKLIENPTNDPNGSDGVVEHKIVDLQIDSKRLANQVGTQDLAENSNPPISVSFETKSPGVRSGQIISVNLTPASGALNISDSFLITQVEDSPIGDGFYSYQVTASSRLKGFGSLMLTLFKKADAISDFQEDDNSPLEEFINGADTLAFNDSGSVTNPGIVGSDEISITDAGILVDGPSPAGTYIYGVATYGSGLVS